MLLAEIKPLLSEPIDIISLEKVLIKHQEFWSVANTLRLLLPFEAYFAKRPALQKLVERLHRNIKKRLQKTQELIYC